jgi:hypothetical protein
MILTYRGATYRIRSEGALIALLTWLQLQDADERRVAA